MGGGGDDRMYIIYPCVTVNFRLGPHPGHPGRGDHPRQLHGPVHRRRLHSAEVPQVLQGWCKWHDKSTTIYDILDFKSYIKNF